MIRSYDRKNLAGMKLANHLKLTRMTRSELWYRLQLIRIVEPLTIEAYAISERNRFVNQEDDSPHGHPWHVSFHASQFPGSQDLACPRQALYQMLDFPRGVFNRRARTVMSAGKAIEVELVNTWHRAGILISAPPDEEVQTGFEYPDVWLTGSVDAVLKPWGWNKPLPVEVKSKYQDTIDQMRIGRVGPDDSHVVQLKVQLALVHLFQGDLWPGLDPVTHGYIYYLSRDKPDETAEFRVDLDLKFFEEGVKNLKQWRAWFEEGYLPSINPSKKHPMGWRWTYPPCKWCSFKKTCQLDHEAGRDDLMDSIGIDRAKKIREQYDPEAARQRVLQRWKDHRTDDRILPGDLDPNRAPEGSSSSA